MAVVLGLLEPRLRYQRGTTCDAINTHVLGDRIAMLRTDEATGVCTAEKVYLLRYGSGDLELLCSYIVEGRLTATSRAANAVYHNRKESR